MSPSICMHNAHSYVFSGSNCLHSSAIFIQTRHPSVVLAVVVVGTAVAVCSHCLFLYNCIQLQCADWSEYFRLNWHLPLHVRPVAMKRVCIYCVCVDWLWNFSNDYRHFFVFLWHRKSQSLISKCIILASVMNRELLFLKLEKQMLIKIYRSKILYKAHLGRSAEFSAFSFCFCGAFASEFKNVRAPSAQPPRPIVCCARGCSDYFMCHWCKSPICEMTFIVPWSSFAAYENRTDTFTHPHINYPLWTIKCGLWCNLQF